MTEAQPKLDPNYLKALQQLRKFAGKDGDLNDDVISKLQEEEAKKKADKKRKKKEPAAAAAAAPEEAPFVIRTKRARQSADGNLAGAAGFPSAAQRSRPRAASDDEGNEHDTLVDDEEDDDDDEIFDKLAPEVADEEDAPTDDLDENSNYFAHVAGLMEERFPGMRDTVPAIWIQNLVLTAVANMRVNVKWLVPRLRSYGVYQNQRRFVAMTRRMSAPRSSTHAFENGKFVNTGSQTIEAARDAVRSFIEVIASVEAEVLPGVVARPYEGMRLVSTKVHNMVGSTTAPFKIDLDAFSKYPFVTYFKLLFVGAIVEIYGISGREEDRRSKALVFDPGNIVLTGMKTSEHILACFKMLYPYVARCAVQSTDLVESSANKSRRRRVSADKRKAAALPAGSTNMIPVDAHFLVDEFRAVNEGRESAPRALERVQQAAADSGSLASLSAGARNAIAMESMNLAARVNEAASSKTTTKLIGAAKPLKIKLLDRSTTQTLASN